MSIGASATRHKIFFSILSFVVIMIALNVISVVANLGMVADLTISGDELLTDQSMSNLAMCGILGKQILTDLIYSVVFFLITNYFLKKKLNLE
jgi:predicted small integral membrane protein